MPATHAFISLQSFGWRRRFDDDCAHNDHTALDGRTVVGEDITHLDKGATAQLIGAKMLQRGSSPARVRLITGREQAVAA